MSDQPHNSGESGERAGQWLDEYARRRRDELGEPLELHEATRTMLQGEVRREYPQPEESAEAASTPPGWMWWGVTAGVGAVAVLAALSLDFTPSSDQPSGAMEMASTTTDRSEEESAEEAEQADRTMAQAKEFTAPNVEENMETAKKAEAVLGVTPRSIPVPPKNGIPTGPAGLNNFGEAGPPSVSVPANQRLRQSSRYNNLADMAQNFTQSRDADVAAPERKAKQLPTPVLVEFQVERSGNTVKVLDQDGSVYTGNVISEERFASAEKANQTNAVDPAAGNAQAAAVGGTAPPPTPVVPAAPRPAVAPSAPVRTASAIAIRSAEGQFFFRVKGTNRTLRQVIVFEATLDGVPNSKGDWRAPGGAPGAFTAGKAPIKAMALSPANNGSARSPSPVSPEVRRPQEGQALKRAKVQFLRVQGNARIGQANYRVDAYQQSEADAAADRAPEKK